MGMLSVKEGVDEFIPWALSNFDCYWLSAWSSNGSVSDIHKDLLPYLPPEAESIPASKWGEYKTDAIVDGNFIWIDDNLLSAEQEYLEKNGWLGRFVHVDVMEPSIRPVMKRIVEVVQG
jgi:hypothetical protein